MLTARDRKRKRSKNTKQASTVVQTVYVFFIDIIPPYVDRHSVSHFEYHLSKSLGSEKDWKCGNQHHTNFGVGGGVIVLRI